MPDRGIKRRDNKKKSAKEDKVVVAQEWVIQE